MTFLTRQAFAKTFNSTPDDLDMHVIYDVSHNIAKVRPLVVNAEILRLMCAAFSVAWFIKQFVFVVADDDIAVAQVEEHMVDGKPRKLLVHRKGATRAFPPHHPLIPVDYQVRSDR